MIIAYYIDDLNNIVKKKFKTIAEIEEYTNCWLIKVEKEAGKDEQKAPRKTKTKKAEKE